MSKKKPCGLDYCPQEEIVGAYASCSACAWGAENESKDKSKRLDNSVERMGMQLQNKAFKAKNGKAYTNCGVVQWKNVLTEQQQRIIFTAEKERANE